MQSMDAEDEQAARRAAESRAATAVAERDQAIRGTNDAVARANREISDRATAEAEAASAVDAREQAESEAQRQSRLRATAEARARRAELLSDRAESEADRQTLLRATAEAVATTAERLAQEEMQRREAAEGQAEQAEIGRSAAERLTALELARTNPTLSGIVHGQISFYLEPLPDYAAQDVDDAVDSVVRRLESMTHAGASLQRTRSSTSADIHVQWVRDYGDHVLGQAINQSVLSIGLGSTNCHDEWRPFTAETVENVLWHEFGHALGYGHSADRTNIMFPTLGTRFAIEREFEEVIAARWAWSFPFCTAGRYHYRVEAEDSDERFAYGVLPLGFDLQDYFDNPAIVDPACESGEGRRVRETCDIRWGSLLVIHNTDSDNAIRISGSIENRNPPPSPNLTWDPATFYYDDETLDYYRELFEEE